ncbi:MAG: cytidylyltransferase family protein [Caldisphaeraceae archaeon]|nr:cytidylyltransferase family protein [Caldisphaeraceae archaeon]MEB3692075.1 cytidylyltransferase family protein [Caldisphaeraceae archaeon]MEB3797857.1 cytidylyltransferase family protein [Caldisphaeraceae archaeon]
MDSARERVQRYINAVTEVFRKVVSKESELRSKGVETSALFTNINAYIEDAKYYLATERLEDALISISYAEGLLDSLAFLNLVELKWSKPLTQEKRVFLAGTFDIVHPGHIGLLKYASSLGKVFVVLARDSNVRKDKGRSTVLDEKARLEVMKSIKYVYKVLLGDKKDYMKPIEDIKPDIILLGPDQKFSEKDLLEQVERRLNKKVKIIRFNEKKMFSGGLKSSTDIIIKGCGIVKGRGKE